VSGPLWRVEIQRPAKKDLDRLDLPVRRRVAKALRALATDPDAERVLRKLKGRPERRLRVGDWRVLVELDQDRRLISVRRILPRGRAYDR